MKLKRVGVMAQCCSKVNLVSCPDMKGSMSKPKLPKKVVQGNL